MENNEMNFEDFATDLNRIRNVVANILDAISIQRTDIQVLKTRVDYLNATVSNELMGDKIYAKICEVHGKPKTVKKDRECDLLSTLSNKDKMQD